MSGNFPQKAPTEFQAVYEPITSSDNRLLLNELIERGINPEGFSCYVIPGTSPFSNLGRATELSAFEILGDDEKSFQEEYGKYERHSIFYLALNAHGRPVAVTRVLNGRNKTVDDINEMYGLDPTNIWSDIGYDEDSAWDIATVGVAKGFRSTPDSSIGLACLFAQVVSDSNAQEISCLTSIVNNYINQKCIQSGINWCELNPSIPKDFNYINCTGNNACYIKVSSLADTIIGRIAGMHSDQNPYFRTFNVEDNQ